jgi:hypothetical protein
MVLEGESDKMFVIGCDPALIVSNYTTSRFMEKSIDDKLQVA